MKPLIRGRIHLAALFVAVAACVILVWQSKLPARTATLIYSFSLIGLYSVSALYHCPMWSRRTYLLLRSIDHAAIFALIAGTATPICLFGLNGELGWHLFFIMWTFAIVGMIMSIVWAHGPKWIRAILYVTAGWLALPYLPEIKSSLGVESVRLLLIGGIIYTVSAAVYALKRPNPFPHIFGYHEIFHVLVVIASGFHFKVIYDLVT